MMENSATLFETQYTTEEAQSCSFAANDCPPILYNLPYPTFKAEKMKDNFPDVDAVIDKPVFPLYLRLFTGPQDGFIYAIDYLS